MLILGIIGFGAVVGAIAQFIVGRRGAHGMDWGLAIVAGLIGSFVGGFLASLIAGDGIKFRPSGVIGSIIGAVIVTLVWRAIVARRTPPPAPAPTGGAHGPRKKTRR